MANLSDFIEEFIRNLMEEERDKEETDHSVEIQRNELADYFHCAPSQINYVLTTRFTLERGYTVESRRGGGGFIRITRVNLNNRELFQWLIENVGEELNEDLALDVLQRLEEKNIITLREADLIGKLLSDKSIGKGKQENAAIRANLMKELFKRLMVYEEK